VVLDLRRRVAEQVNQAKVSISGDSGEGDGTEDEDGGWKFVGDWLKPDPAEDLHRIGVKLKFWALANDDDTDDEIVSQSPDMPDLVRQAALHGFTKDQLFEAELALQESLVRRRVEETKTLVSMDMKVELVRHIMKALIDVRRTTMKPWSGKLPRPRQSPVMTLDDCTIKDKRGRRPMTGGTFVDALRSSPSPATWETQ
jgi:hypothetical protein